MERLGVRERRPSVGLAVQDERRHVDRGQHGAEVGLRPGVARRSNGCRAYVLPHHRGQHPGAVGGYELREQARVGLRVERITQLGHAEEHLEPSCHLLWWQRPCPARVATDEHEETVTLDQFRLRHALYKTDGDLQRAHARFPFVVTWDDHEVDNDYTGDIPEDGTPPEVFRLRRIAGYQAFYEHLSLRAPAQPDRHGQSRLYRSIPWGPLAEFFVVDTRQYRSDHPVGDGEHPYGPASFDPSQTVLGAQQERWVRERFRRSQAQWNVLANQVLFSELAHELYRYTIGGGTTTGPPACPSPCARCATDPGAWRSDIGHECHWLRPLGGAGTARGPPSSRTSAPRRAAARGRARR